MKLKHGDKVLVECTVEAVFVKSGMVMVITRDCDKGFDAYEDEVMAVMPDTVTKCENAVDRDTIIREMEKRHKEGDAITIGYIKNLPPVTPKQRTGKWIPITNKNGTRIALRCDACGESPKHAIESDFCPNCGTKMEGVNK